jgi:hypothetical protein
VPLPAIHFTTYQLNPNQPPSIQEHPKPIHNSNHHNHRAQPQHKFTQPSLSAFIISTIPHPIIKTQAHDLINLHLCRTIEPKHDNGVFNQATDPSPAQNSSHHRFLCITASSVITTASPM